MLVKGRKAWEEARATGIGASDAAAILGVSPWKGALQLFHEKKGTVATGTGETFARKLGLLLEDPIAELYSQDTGRLVARPKAGEFDLVRHPTLPFMMATLDGRQVGRADEKEVAKRGSPSLLEIKTAGVGKMALWENEAPIDYQVQVQHQLACCAEYAWGTCVCLVGGVSLRFSDIDRDPEFIRLLEAAICEFWDRFQRNEPPPADGTEATKDFLKRLYPNARPTSIALGPESLEWDAELQAAAADVKAATNRKLLAENRLKSAMGDNVQGVLPSGAVYTWKTINRRAYEVQPCTFRDFRRHGTKAERRPKIQPGAAPSVAGLQDTFAAEQNAEAAAEDFDVSFD